MEGAVASSSRSLSHTPPWYPSQGGHGGYNNMLGAMDFMQDNNLAGYNGDLSMYGGDENNFRGADGGEENNFGV